MSRIYGRSKEFFRIMSEISWWCSFSWPHYNKNVEKTAASPTLLQCPQTQAEGKIFPVTPTEEETASRRTVGWVVTEAAELGHALNNLWPWAGREDGSPTDSGQGFGERSNPTCAYSNAPSFSVFLPALLNYFLYNYIQEKDREDPSRIVLFYLQSPSHPHSCQKDMWLGEPAG